MIYRIKIVINLINFFNFLNKMKTIFKVLAISVVTGILVVISCSRSDLLLSEIDDQFIQAEKEAVLEAVLEKVDIQIEKDITMLEKYNYNPSLKKSEEIGPCNAEITVETPENKKFPKTITLDFGEGCTDAEGNFRAGQIIVHITGPYWEKNTVRNSKLSDYIYNDLKISGNRHAINKGKNDEGYYVFEVKNSEKISTTEGQLIVERDWTRVRTYNRGSDLKTNSDDEVWITGSAQVKRADKELVKEITVPLYRPFTCQHFQSGIITTFINKEEVSQLNYGTYIAGECDNLASWTNGVDTKTITLKTGINYHKIKQ